MCVIVVVVMLSCFVTGPGAGSGGGSGGGRTSELLSGGIKYTEGSSDIVSARSSANTASALSVCECVVLGE